MRLLAAHEPRVFEATRASPRRGMRQKTDLPGRELRGRKEVRTSLRARPVRRAEATGERLIARAKSERLDVRQRRGLAVAEDHRSSIAVSYTHLRAHETGRNL